MLGENIERYRVEATLGEGALAAVYRVKHDELGSIHALKVLRLGNADAREQLLNEGRKQARVQHPNLVAVTDILAAGDRPALVLEYVDGPTLQQWLSRRKLPLEEALALFHGIVRGVGAAHAALLLHRDLKPSNILLAQTPEGMIPKVADFGLALDLGREELSSEPALGTLGYLAPEALRGEPDLDERLDLFALGCVLYEMLTGTRAFDGPDLVSTAERTLAGDYVPAEALVPLPEPVSRTLHQLLAVDREDRIGSCAELLDTLYGGEEGLLAQEISLEPSTRVIPVPTTPAVDTPLPQGKRSPWQPVALALLVMYAITAAGTMSLLMPRSEAEQIKPGAEPQVWSPPVVPVLAVEQIEEEPPRPIVPEIEAPVRPARVARRPGVVQVEGDGYVELIGPNGQRGAPGEVQPGRWRYRARFGHQPGPAGSFEVRPGDTVTLRCSSFAVRCIAR